MESGEKKGWFWPIYLQVRLKKNYRTEELTWPSYQQLSHSEITFSHQDVYVVSYVNGETEQHTCYMIRCVHVINCMLHNQGIWWTELPLKLAFNASK